MSSEEVGCYIRLLCVQWNAGSIPDDLDILKRYGGATPSPFVLSKFRKVGAVLKNHRLEVERRKQKAFRVKCSESGTKGAEKRWGGHGKPKATPIAKHSSPISGLQLPILNTFGIKLSTPRMLEIWPRWMEHRRTKPKPKSWEVMFNNQIKFLEQYDEPTAFEIVQLSLTNGYQGLFPPKNYGSQTTHGNHKNNRNFGIIKGPTDYAAAAKEKLAKQAMARQMATIETSPPPDSGNGTGGV